MRATTRTSGGNRGAVLATELAVVIVVLTFLALICIDFGRFAYHYVAVTNAARAGGEYAITNPIGSSQAAWRDRIQATARAELANQSNCDPNRLTTEVTVASDANGVLQARVVATYTGFHTVVSWPGIPDAPTLRARVVMPVIR